MDWRRFIARNVLGVRAEELPWAQDAWRAVENGGPLYIAADNLIKRFGLDPRTDPEARQLRNNLISMFYLKSYTKGQANELRETLDILVAAPKRGGMFVYFTDGRPVSWDRPNAVHKHDVPERERYWYIKILEVARNTKTEGDPDAVETSQPCS